MLAEFERAATEARSGARHALFAGAYARPIVLAILLAMFNQLSGINAILYYLNDIFAAAGFSGVSQDLQAVAIGAANLIATVFALRIIDRVGRKKLLLIGAVGTAVAQACAAFIMGTGAGARVPAGGAGGLHRILRVFAGRGDLGVPERDFSDGGAITRAVARQHHALGHEFTDRHRVSGDRGEVTGSAVRILRGLHGVAVLRGAGDIPRDPRRGAGIHGARTRTQDRSFIMSQWNRRALFAASLGAGCAIAAVASAEESCGNRPNTAPALQPPLLLSDWAWLARYREENEKLLASGVKVDAVFIGDSITEGWVQNQPEFFQNGIVGRGISAQTTPQILVRMYPDVIALKPRVVHIMAGTNDIAQNTGPMTAQDSKHNLMAMCEIAQAHKIRVVLGSVPPASKYWWQPQAQPKAAGAGDERMAARATPNRSARDMPTTPRRSPTPAAM